MSDLPRRLGDSRELRALAHPVRLMLMQVLYERGSATATEVAEVIGESPANCSWHLRQLAKYGFIKEAERRKGRQRPWRPVGTPLSWGHGDEPDDVAAASDELSTVLMDQALAGLRSWLAWRRTDPAEWQQAAAFAESSTWLTADELAEVNAAIAEILFRHRRRKTDPMTRPDGARRVRMFAWAIPAEPLRGARSARDRT